MANTENIKEYTIISKIRIKRGFIFKSLIDPSNEVELEIEQFLKQEKTKFNQIVSNTFDLPENGVKKFEFYFIPNRVTAVSDEETKFRTKASVTLLYLKPQSLIYFETDYLFAINSGCGANGDLMYYGGKNYELEEIYFNKITTVGAYHNEEMINIISGGCNGSEARYTLTEDGFVIRAGENFKVVASEKYRSELNDARKNVNNEISNINS